jgi:two-component system chemotaxis response regulator CheY
MLAALKLNQRSIMSNRPASAAINAPARKKFPFENIAVLVVEDAQHLAGLVCGILKSFGIRTIYSARNGEDALFILANHHVQVAIVDDLQPPLDGHAVLKTLRAPGSGLPSDVPVIFVTEKPFKDNILAARDSGATEVLSKPFSANQLMTRIESVMRKPRPIIQGGSFVGPDRRRQMKSHVEKKRKSDHHAN